MYFSWLKLLQGKVCVGVGGGQARCDFPGKEKLPSGGLQDCPARNKVSCFEWGQRSGTQHQQGESIKGGACKIKIYNNSRVGKDCPRNPVSKLLGRWV